MINVFVKINKYICDIKSAKCSIIIDEFSVWGGGTKPIVNYYKYQQKKNNLINFLVLRNKKSFFILFNKRYTAVWNSSSSPDS